MGHMKWPPKLMRTDVLGEIKDVSGRKINRDIGRTCWLGNNTYYAFGDSFCHDKRGEFVGVTNNTIALCPNPVNEPTKSDYVEGGMLVRPFVPHTRGEEEWENEPEHKKKNDRVTCWSFGGIIEERDGCGTGWVFFDKMLTHGGAAGHHFGMGVARASVQPDKTLKVERPMGEQMVFGEGEPKFGSISHLIDDDGWVYLMGGHDPNPQAFDMRCHLARIRRDADFTKRENYEVWINTLDGKGMWEKHYKSIDDLKKLGDLDIQAQGAIFKAPSFAPEGKPYLWIGVNKFGVGHFYIGAAPAVTGPWEVQDLDDLPRDPKPHDGKSSGPKYALYPNPRASDLQRGEMLCTWTDAAQLGGKVIAARFWFEGGYERAPPPAPAGASKEERRKSGGLSELGDTLKSKLGGFLKR